MFYNVVDLDDIFNSKNESNKYVHVFVRYYNNDEYIYYIDYNSGKSSDNNEYGSHIDVVVNESKEGGGELQDF